MTAKLIPNSDKVIFFNDKCGDVVVNLGDYPDIDTAISQEDIPIVGDYSDYSGSGVRPSQEVLNAGLENTTFGDVIMDAQDAKVSSLTERGERSATHRQRAKLITIN